MNPNEKGGCVEKSANPLKRERSKRGSDRKNRNWNGNHRPSKLIFRCFQASSCRKTALKNDESGGSHEQLGKKYF